MSALVISLVKSRMRESCKSGSVRGWPRKGPVYSTNLRCCNSCGAGCGNESAAFCAYFRICSFIDNDANQELKSRRCFWSFSLWQNKSSRRNFPKTRDFLVSTLDWHCEWVGCAAFAHSHTLAHALREKCFGENAVSAKNGLKFFAPAGANSARL